MLIPIVQGGDKSSGKLTHVLESTSFERQGTKLFPPWFDQVEPSCILRQELNLDLRPRQQSAFHISAFMDTQIVFNHKPSLRRKGMNHLLQQLDVCSPIGRGDSKKVALPVAGSKAPCTHKVPRRP